MIHVASSLACLNKVANAIIFTQERHSLSNMRVLELQIMASTNFLTYLLM